MTAETTDAGQLSIPLGANVFWADLADEEERRCNRAAKEQAPSTDVYTLLPLEQWRQQSVQQDASLNDELVDGQLYAIDGGIFKAKQEDGRWTLWVWQGRNGNDVGTRTGFEVDGAGKLYERLYDLDAEEILVMETVRFEVADLVASDPSLPIYGSEAATIIEQHKGRES